MAFSLLRFSTALATRATRLPKLYCPRYTVSSLTCQRSIHTTSPLGLSSEDDLERAKQKLNALTEDPGNEVKLKLYSLFKQATIGQCNTKRPGAFDFVGRAKWDAWNGLGDLSKSEAIQQYCQIVDDVVGSSDEKSTTSDTNVTSSTDYKEIIVTDDGGARTILFNRPAKYNALNYQMYTEVQHALQAAGRDDSIVVTVITGAGDYYCSGNDLSNFAQIPPEGPEKLAAQAKQILLDFVSAFIEFPKPLIAAVNGPAVGISVTLLGLCDLVYAVEHATFHTPFMQLGQSPEGCSSVLFPRIMGGARANEVLLLGHKLTANEAYERGLITRVFSAREFQDKIKEIVTRAAALPPKSLAKSKQLLRAVQLDTLQSSNKAECELLEERWLSEECMKAIMDFMQRKK